MSGTGRSVAEISKELRSLEASGPSRASAGRAKGRVNAANRERAFEARLSKLRSELNTALISAGGPDGLRVGIQRAEDAIASLEDELENNANRRVGRARQAINRRLAEQKQLLQQLNTALVNTELGAEGDSAPTKTPASPEADKLIEKLKLQASAFGQTKEQITLYRIEAAKANAEQMALAQSLIKTVSEDEAFEAAVKASEDAVKAENAAYQAWREELQGEGKQAVEDARTAQEKYNDQIERYKYLLDQGALSQTEYEKVTEKARKDLEGLSDSGEEAMQRLEAVTRRWGSEFTNTLADMVQSGKLNFKNLADAIIKDLLRIMIYQRITQPLFAKMNIPGFASGGQVVGPGSGTSDSIPARLSNGEYVIRAEAVRAYSPGFLESINRMILPRFANVPGISISRPDTHFSDGGLVSPVKDKSSGNIKVEIINKGQPVEASDAEVSFDYDGMVVKIVTDDIGRDGTISNAFTRAFNLRRGGG